MCTLTILHSCPGESTQRGFRLAFSRDEQRDRLSGTGPAVETAGSGRAILPRDPVGGGTWIAVNDSGLAFCLLNVNPPRSDAAARGGATRGALIPRLLHLDSLAAVEEALPGLDADIQRPHRLVVTDGSGILEAIGGGGVVEHRSHRPKQPFMRSSSGLGDHVVEPLRREAFDRFIASNSWVSSSQDEFHRLRFEGRDECSIDMSRPDARTVSWTVIEVEPEAVRMIHHSAPPRDRVRPVTVELQRVERSGRPIGQVAG